jgi:hypothetical protein
LAARAYGRNMASRSPPKNCDGVFAVIDTASKTGAENGATALQLMAMFDWSTFSQAEVYSRFIRRITKNDRGHSWSCDVSRDRSLCAPSASPREAGG